MKTILLLLACASGSTFLASTMLAGTGSLPEASIFKAGAEREYEVMFPKDGFIGSPPAPRGTPLRFRPRDENDYEHRLIRVALQERRQVEGLQRMVLRIDEIDKYHRVIRKALYFAYVDISAEGTRSLCKVEDDGWGGAGDDDEVKYGIPFPFDCTVPPVLGFTKSARSGYLTCTGFGVDALLTGTNKTGAGISVEATKFEKLGAPSDNLPKTVRWHGAEVVDVSKTNSTTRIRFREKQEWAKMDDWLLTKMERFDNDGNLMLRCVQWTNSPPAATTPQAPK